MVPGARERTRMLDPGNDLLDPAGEDISAYRECRERIAGLVAEAVDETP